MATKTKLAKPTTGGDNYPVMFLDIETRGNEKAIALLDPIRAPGNLKDPAKIEAAIEEKTQERIERAPLDSDLGLIAGIGYKIGSKGEVVVNIVTKKNTEVKVLEDFWMQFAIVGGRCAGYNILNFDLPYIVKRSFDLGVRPSLLPTLIKYRTEPVTDLFMLLCGWDYRNGHNFKWICKRYGITVLDEGTDGSMVKDMNEAELKKYMVSDVTATCELYFRMRGYYFI